MENSTSPSPRRRVGIFFVVLLIVLCIAVTESFFSYQQNSEYSSSATTASNNIVATMTLSSDMQYEFNSDLTKDSAISLDKLPPAHVTIVATTILDAIESFAEQYSLTVDSIQNDQVTYITRYGQQFTIKVKQVVDKQYQSRSQN